MSKDELRRGHIHACQVCRDIFVESTPKPACEMCRPGGFAKCPTCVSKGE